jgi:cytochrome c
MSTKPVAILVTACCLLQSASALGQEDDDILSVDESLLAPDVPTVAAPELDAERGRELFVSKGCVICHAINGVGGNAIGDLSGKQAPSLEAEKMPMVMDPYAFFAKMWRGAASMIVLQREQLGYQIDLRGDEIGDIMAFLHDREEQERFTPESFVPPVFWYRETTEDEQE